MTSISVQDSNQPRLFFLDAPGGTGKTFLYNTLINWLEGQSKKVIAVASTGIASTLLTDGTTYHSQFKIYPPITEVITSLIQENDFNAKKIREASLIISDEATMKLNHSLNAIDQLFRRVMKKPKVPFGGKVVLCGGDFRQCLPVVRHGTRVKVVESTIKNSDTWPLFRQLRLQKNMRTSVDRQEHADWLLKLGNGTLPATPGLSLTTIKIPAHFLLSQQDVSIVQFVFGDPENLLQPEQQNRMADSSILCPKNEDCLRINNSIINLMPGEAVTFKSIDSVDSDNQEEINNYPTEFLNCCSVSGLPPHELKLKIGTIIILLKNIDTRQGLCNGTRLIVNGLTNNIIVATICAGKTKGKKCFLPRIAMSSGDSYLPISLKRLQFPVLLAFAITINKSQGQTFERVGIHLPQPVFSHGQLYVAFSRATSSAGTRVDWIGDSKQGYLNKDAANQLDKERVYTQNIVYQEAML